MSWVLLWSLRILTTITRRIWSDFKEVCLGFRGCLPNQEEFWKCFSIKHSFVTKLYVKWKGLTLRLYKHFWSMYTVPEVKQYTFTFFILCNSQKNPPRKDSETHLSGRKQWDSGMFSDEPMTLISLFIYSFGKPFEYLLCFRSWTRLLGYSLKPVIIPTFKLVIILCTYECGNSLDE